MTTRKTHILGISCFYHDAAACIVTDGEVIAAAEEERFTRRKHDPAFPSRAVAYCLEEAGIEASRLDHVVFYEKPFVKFERIVESILATAPRSFSPFLKAFPLWAKEKIHLPDIVARETGYRGSCLFTAHHESHAASAFFPSPFGEAAFLTVDGVGEWATAAWGTGKGNRIEMGGELRFPDSLGMLYSTFTQYLGFEVNSGEYKVMGLAPYGDPSYLDRIRSELVDIREDGSFRLNMDCFDYVAGIGMAGRRFHGLFGGPPREPEGAIERRHMDLACSVQKVTEVILLRMARHVRRETGMTRLCMAGGVALNCTANGNLLREGIFDEIWVQPAAGDAGGSLGAALLVWHHRLGNPRRSRSLDARGETRLGPAFGDNEIASLLRNNGIPFRMLGKEETAVVTAGLLAEGNVVGWFQGRMEFGPRALGSRSILGDPRLPGMQRRINRKVKFRESFRPFAPVVLEECAREWFDMDSGSPYMQFTFPVRAEKRLPVEDDRASGLDRLSVPRSLVPAVTHVDYSSRVQTLSREHDPRFHDLIGEFHRLTGCPMILNTSFNVRGEPIVCSPEDAVAVFLRTEIDYLVLGSFLLDKREIPAGVLQGEEGGSGGPPRIFHDPLLSRVMRIAHRFLTRMAIEITRLAIHLLLGLVFFVIVTPAAVASRVLRRQSPVFRPRLPGAGSYWVKPPAATWTADRYDRMY